jgi:formate/nitrite transporter FocA (FNT family)
LFWEYDRMPAARKKGASGDHAASGTGPTVELSAREEREVQRRSPLRAAVVFETIRREGQGELERSTLSLAASGLAAGLSMGFSLVASGLILARLPDASWRPLVVGLGYTVGFLIVVLGRQQLFTENTLTVILPLLDDPDKLGTFGKVVRLWGTVLASNLAGAALFAFAVVHAGPFTAADDRAFSLLGHAAASGSFGHVVVGGIFAGWLIALMVWLQPAAETQRPAIILILTYLIAIASFSHIIAGSVEVLYLVVAGQLPFAAYCTNFLLPVFIGNVIGGVSLVAILNYAQVALEPGP